MILHFITSFCFMLVVSVGVGVYLFFSGCKENSSCGLWGTFKVSHKTAFLKGKSASLGENGA